MTSDLAARPVYTSTFTFGVRAFDAEFHAIDQHIAEAARAIPGYLGEEAWENPTTGLVCNVYYWSSLEALRTLIEHPAHLVAKQRQAEWLDGYQVVIAQVMRCYGDGGIAHPLADRIAHHPTVTYGMPSQDPSAAA